MASNLRFPPTQPQPNHRLSESGGFQWGAAVSAHTLFVWVESCCMPGPSPPRNCRRLPIKNANYVLNLFAFLCAESERKLPSNPALRTPLAQFYPSPRHALSNYR